MNSYIKLSDMTYPLFEGDIRLTNSDIPQHLTGDGFPCPEGYALVQFTPPPQYSIENNEYIVEVAPKLVDGIWTMVWEKRVRAPEELNLISNGRQVL